MAHDTLAEHLRSTRGVALLQRRRQPDPATGATRIPAVVV